MDPIIIIFTTAGCVALLCWILSLITKDTSWVDRIWSVVPAVYMWIFSAVSISEGKASAALILTAVLTTLWAARLTFNFARKGGYTGVEDYRWAILREKMSPALFQAFNLFFIVIYQNLLLALIAMPGYIMWKNPTNISGWEILLAACFIAFLTGETIADQQQWNFHQSKKAAGGTLSPGFNTTGLFRFSRHPNFFFEQSQWWVVYLLGATSALRAGLGFWGGAINWTIIGATLLTLLFIGSTKFTEWISSNKYPEYADYKKTTSPMIPMPPRKPSPTK